MDKSRHDKACGHGAGGVGSRLRQRLAQLLHHSSCATTSATAFVGTNAAASAATVITNNNTAASRRHEPPPPPPFSHEQEPKPIHGRCQRGRRRRSSRAALVHISIDCSARSVGAAVLPSPAPRDVGAAVKSATRSKNGNGDSKRISSPLYSWSSSSTDGEMAPFSSDDGERRGQATTDTRSTLFSSHSFSSDSTADFYYGTGPSSARSLRRHRNAPLPPRRAPPPSQRRAPRPAAAFRTPTAAAKGSKRGGKEEEEEKKKKVAERKDGGAGVAAAAGSTAVVKRSHDPYADFRSSMVEMVAGRRLLCGDALGELLVWYLTLNSPRHHPAILAAFEDVWEAVLGSEP